MQYDSDFFGPIYSVGGITINGGTDANGCDWTLTQESGWNGRPAVKTTRTDRPSGPGTYYAPEYPGGRVIALTGEVAAPNVQTLRVVERQIAAILPSPVDLSPLTVVDETGLALTAMVKIDGAPITTPKSAFTSVFSLQFFAPDPRKHGSSHSYFAQAATPGTGGIVYPVTYPVDYGLPGSAGAVVAVNNGTADAEPIMTLTGPLTAPITITNFATGSVLNYTGSPKLGETVVINCATGAVLLNGVNRRNMLSVNNWPTIPASSSVTFTYTTGSQLDTGGLTVAYDDMYY